VNDFHLHPTNKSNAHHVQCLKCCSNTNEPIVAKFAIKYAAETSHPLEYTLVSPSVNATSCTLFWRNSMTKLNYPVVTYRNSGLM